jgi:hypothetical protein
LLKQGATCSCKIVERYFKILGQDLNYEKGSKTVTRTLQGSTVTLENKNEKKQDWLDNNYSWRAVLTYSSGKEVHYYQDDLNELKSLKAITRPRNQQF